MGKIANQVPQGMENRKPFREDWSQIAASNVST